MVAGTTVSSGLFTSASDAQKCVTSIGSPASPFGAPGTAGVAGAGNCAASRSLLQTVSPTISGAPTCPSNGAPGKDGLMVPLSSIR